MHYLYVPPGSVVRVRLPVATANGNNFVPSGHQAGHQITPDMARGTDDNDSHPLIYPFVRSQGEELFEFLR